MPVIYAASGNCHVYVDADADLDAAEAIALNAKVHRPGVCNAAETLLVHADVAAEFLPRALRTLHTVGVELRCDERAAAHARDHDGEIPVVAATEEDWATEYLDLILAVRVVDSAEEAIAHVNRYGSGHSEAIVTEDLGAARAFQLGVDAACVYVNASTRFTDGGEFGMGAEIGNSTQKLHARGPIGLRELCTFKYLIEGTGQVRSLEARHPRRHLQPPAHRPSRLRAGGARAARRWIASCWCRPACRRTSRSRRTPARRRATSCAGRRRGRRALRGLAAGARSSGTVLHGRYPEGVARPQPAGRHHLHRRGGHGPQPAELAGAGGAAVARDARRRRARRSTSAMRSPPRSPRWPDPERVRFFDMPRIDVSSSLVRERVAGGRPIRYLVPDAVADAIAQNGWYAA